MPLTDDEMEELRNLAQRKKARLKGIEIWALFDDNTQQVLLACEFDEGSDQPRYTGGAIIKDILDELEAKHVQSE